MNTEPFFKWRKCYITDHILVNSFGFFHFTHGLFTCLHPKSINRWLMVNSCWIPCLSHIYSAFIMQGCGYKVLISSSPVFSRRTSWYQLLWGSSWQVSGWDRTRMPSLPCLCRELALLLLRALLFHRGIFRVNGGETFCNSASDAHSHRRTSVFFRPGGQQVGDTSRDKPAG